MEEKDKPQETPIPNDTYACDDCDKKCKSKQGLTKHKKTCKKGSASIVKEKPLEKQPPPQEDDVESLETAPPSSPIQVKITKTKRKIQRPKRKIHIQREVIEEDSEETETDSDEDELLIKKIYREYEREKELRKQIKRDKRRKDRGERLVLDTKHRREVDTRPRQALPVFY
jgi:hypothetical protein